MKKKKHEEHENLERWLVSYADFITLLFAFFTVLYALSMTDKAKYKSAVENIQRAFLSAGGIFPLRGSPFSPFERPADKGSYQPPSNSDAGQFAKEGSKAEDRKAAEQVKAMFEKATGLTISTSDVEIIRSEDGYRIRLAEHLLFRAGSSKIRQENIPFLLELGKRLDRADAKVQIEGHTDTVLNQSSEANWKLSLDRAYNVVQFLVQGAGMKASNLSLAGYGDAAPVTDNDTPQGRTRNRRVEIAVRLPDRNQVTLGLDDDVR